MEQRQAQLFHDIRARAMSTTAAALGLPPSNPKRTILGIVMETSFPEAVASLVCYANGDAGFYFSNGEGAVGGIADEKIRRAAIDFVHESEELASEMQSEDEYPLPSIGWVRFHLLTDRGRFTATAPQEDLIDKRSPLSTLFFKGHAVIAQFRHLQQALKRQMQQLSH